jgi:hypothetical protein
VYEAWQRTGNDTFTVRMKSKTDPFRSDQLCKAEAPASPPDASDDDCGESQELKRSPAISQTDVAAKDSREEAAGREQSFVMIECNSGRKVLHVLNVLPLIDTDFVQQNSKPMLNMSAFALVTCGSPLVWRSNVEMRSRGGSMGAGGLHRTTKHAFEKTVHLYAGGNEVRLSTSLQNTPRIRL